MKQLPSGEYVTTKNFRLWGPEGHFYVTPGMIFGCSHNIEKKRVSIYNGYLGFNYINERDFIRFFILKDAIMTRKEKFVQELSGVAPDPVELISRRNKIIQMKKRK